MVIGEFIVVIGGELVTSEFIVALGGDLATSATNCWFTVVIGGEFVKSATTERTVLKNGSRRCLINSSFQFEFALRHFTVHNSSRHCNIAASFDVDFHDVEMPSAPKEWSNDA